MNQRRNLKNNQGFTNNNGWRYCGWLCVFIGVWWLGLCCLVNILDTKAERERDASHQARFCWQQSFRKKQHNVCKQCYLLKSGTKQICFTAMQRQQPWQQWLCFSEGKCELVALHVITYTSDYCWGGKPVRDSVLVSAAVYFNVRWRLNAPLF